VGVAVVAAFRAYAGRLRLFDDPLQVGGAGIRKRLM